MSASPRASARKHVGRLHARRSSSASRGWLARSAAAAGATSSASAVAKPAIADGADDPLGVGGDVRRRGLELGEHDVSVADEHLGRAGEAHAAAVALDHRLADLALERRELLRHGGGREVERVGGRGERSLLGDLAEHAQAAGVDHAAELTDSRAECLLALMSPVPASWPWMPARSVALVVLVTAVWGVNFVVIHVGLDHFPPLLFNALRFAVMAVPAIFLVGRPQVAWRFVLGFGFLLGVVKFGLLFVSLDLGMPVGLVLAAAAAAGDLHDRDSPPSSCASGRGASRSPAPRSRSPGSP